jgi:hypothetical protein
MFGEHGRELISAEIGLSFVTALHDAVCSRSSDVNLLEIDVRFYLSLRSVQQIIFFCILFDFGIYFGKKNSFCANLQESSYASTEPYSSPNVLSLLSNWDLTIMPIVSPSARELAERFDFCNRKNSHGVDVNRNYPFHFGEGEQTINSQSEQFGGNSPLTEPETRIAADIAQHIHPQLFVAVHSGAEMIVTSPAYRRVSVNHD